MRLPHRADDTKLLAPAGAGSLKALGELLGFPKLEVPSVARRAALIGWTSSPAAPQPDDRCRRGLFGAAVRRCGAIPRRGALGGPPAPGPRGAKGKAPSCIPPRGFAPPAKGRRRGADRAHA